MTVVRALALVLVAVGAACGEDGGDAPAPARDAPSTRAAAPTRAEVDRLRALGYLDFASDEDRDDPARAGVVRHDAARTQPGYRLYNEQHRAAAVLMDATGRVLHRFSDPHGKYWARAELLPDGDVVAVGAVDRGQRRVEITDADRYVARFGWDGALRWKRAIGAHHDVEPLPDGRLLVLAMESRRIAAIDPDVDTRDDVVVELAADGRELARHSIYALLAGGPFPFAFGDVRAHLEVTQDERRERGGVARADGDVVDLLHTNSIDRMDQAALEGASPLHRADSLLLTSRHQDAIAVVSTQAGELRWAWGRGELSGPHDASWLANGRVLVFDNGLGRNWSRVLEVDPRTNAIVWEWRHPDPERFYTASRGSAQRLANGNTLVSNSGAGQAFEVTADGAIVWEFWNPARGPGGRRATIGRMRWLDASFVEPLLARFGEAGD